MSVSESSGSNGLPHPLLYPYPTDSSESDGMFPFLHLADTDEEIDPIMDEVFEELPLPVEEPLADIHPEEFVGLEELDGLMDAATDDSGSDSSVVILTPPPIPVIEILSSDSESDMEVVPPVLLAAVGIRAYPSDSDFDEPADSSAAAYFAVDDLFAPDPEEEGLVPMDVEDDLDLPAPEVVVIPDSPEAVIHDPAILAPLIPVIDLVTPPDSPVPAPATPDTVDLPPPTVEAIQAVDRQLGDLAQWCDLGKMVDHTDRLIRELQETRARLLAQMAEVSTRMMYPPQIIRDAPESSAAAAARPRAPPSP